MTFPSQGTAISVTALDFVPYSAGTRLLNHRIVGFGTLSHSFTPARGLKLRRGSVAIGIWGEEVSLLDWLEDVLTRCELLIGDGLPATLGLLRAHIDKDRHIGLSELVNGPPSRHFDLTTRRWHGGRRPFVETCRRAGIKVMNDRAVNYRDAWFFSQTGVMKAHLANRAVASWRLWASHHTDDCDAAAKAELLKLDEWLHASVAERC